MKVLKFGGTSVGSVDGILSLKEIVEQQSLKQPVIVVVSALGGITDKLIETARLATDGKIEYKNEFESIVQRHHDIINAVIKEQSDRKELSETVDGQDLTRRIPDR